VAEAHDARFDELHAILLRVQHELFNLGSILATSAGGRPSAAGARHGSRCRAPSGDGLHERRASAVALFRAARGSRLNAELHVCRTVCRRAERALVTLADGIVPGETVAYLNRLS
jgi:cob(I)alamin adenosyltransferase